MDNELITGNKPLSILREELIGNLVDLINNSGVPYLLVEPLLENMLNQVRQINAAQLKIDKDHWAKQNGGNIDEN